jgi:5-methylcytosine-specific restriction protein A
MALNAAAAYRRNMKTTDFRAELDAQIERASTQGRAHIEVNAGELHRTVGGYPPLAGKHHAMPTCCDVMRHELRRGGAEVTHQTDSGNAPALTICYYLPRPPHD